MHILRRSLAAMAIGSAAVLTLPGGSAHAQPSRATADITTVSGCSAHEVSTSVLSSDRTMYPDFDLLKAPDGTDLPGGALDAAGGLENAMLPDYFHDPGILEVRRSVVRHDDGTDTVTVTFASSSDVALSSDVVKLSLPKANWGWSAASNAQMQALGAPYTRYTFVAPRLTGSGSTGATLTSATGTVAASQGFAVQATAVVSDAWLGARRTFEATADVVVADKPFCSSALPTVTQTPVDGTDNDTVAIHAGDAILANDTGWHNGTRVLSFGSSDNNRPFLLPDGKPVLDLNMTLTDAGAWKTGPVTRKVTTTTDPVVGNFLLIDVHAKTAAQVARIRHAESANYLTYADYGFLKPVSTIETVAALKTSEVTRAGNLTKALNNRTTKVANIGGTLAVGKDRIDAFRIADVGSTRWPWTAKPDNRTATSPHLWTHVTVPRPVTTTTTVTTTGKVQPAVAAPAYADADQ